ncbi:MAG: FMN-binding protein [Gaiellaceae bacterium]
MNRRRITAVAGIAALVIPVANAAAGGKKKITTITRKINGPQAVADRWGYVQVTLVVKKTTTIVGKHKKVKRRITGVKVPVYPDHTDRSVFINQQALPYLMQEVLQAQFNPNIDMIGGATATSYAFEQSLQAALFAAKKV